MFPVTINSNAPSALVMTQVPVNFRSKLKPNYIDMFEISCLLWIQADSSLMSNLWAEREKTSSLAQ